ncbi:MAG TPA: hypothetical protein VIO32_10085 [Candidatus Baltobacteraceae bacterium]
MTGDELAAVIAALQAATSEQTMPEPASSAWKRAARAESVGSDVP